MRKRSILSLFLLAALMTACKGDPAKASAQIIRGASETEAGKTKISAEAQGPGAEGTEKGGTDDEDSMQILVQWNGHTIIFELNGSPAARSLYSQLPLNVEIEDYGSNEKIFYPPDELEIGDTPLTEGGEKGGLAYFAPWKDVVMYYGSFGSYNGLYDLGTAISGSEWIEELSGKILIEPAERPV